MNGFIKTIILIIVGLAILGALGFDVRDLVSKPIIKDNVIYGWGVLKTVWFDFVLPSVSYVWTQLFLPLWNTTLGAIV